MNKTLTFKTKVDVNGNQVKLDIDVVNQTYQKGYHHRYSHPEDVILTQREMDKLISQLRENNFTEVI